MTDRPIAIVAQDPGKRTGLALWTEAGGLEVEERDVPGYFQWIHAKIHELTTAGYDVRLVSEAFIITMQTAKNSQAGWSLELIGVMKFISYLYGTDPVTIQTSSVAKRFATDAKLRALDWFTKGKPHGNDAVRHLVTYAATHKLIFSTDTLKELAVA